VKTVFINPRTCPCTLTFSPSFSQLRQSSAAAIQSVVPRSEFSWLECCLNLNAQLLNLICSAMVGRKCKTGQVKCNKELLRIFVHRKAGIMKKAHELSVLCGVAIAVVIFGPDKDAPHVWPQKLENLHGIIGRYLSISPDQRNKSKTATTMSDFVTRKGVEFEQELSDEDEDEEVDEEEEEEGKDT